MHPRFSTSLAATRPASPRWGFRAGLAAALLGLLAGGSACQPEALSSSRARNLVIVGDSLSSGHQNGCTVHGQQEHGYAKVLAEQAGWRLEMPLIASPGARPCMEILVTDNPASIRRVDVGGDPNDPATWGTRLNPGVQPANLGTPGTRVVDAFSAPPDDSFHGLFGLDYPAMWSRFLDTPDKSPNQSMLALAYGLLTAAETDRDVAILWLGSNDALWSAIGGTDAALTPLEYFAPAFDAVLGTLSLTRAELVVANIPDLTLVPHFASAADAVLWTGCVSPAGLNPEDRVTLQGLWNIQADCAGWSAAVNDTDVLTPTEVAAISAMIAEYNAHIAAAAATFGAAFVDVAALLEEVQANGYTVGADTLTTAYCGGVFSLDGVHPTNTGYAVVANAFIAAMGTQLGYAIPPVDVAVVRASEPPRNLCVAGP